MPGATTTRRNPPGVGDLAPDFTLPDAAGGGAVSLSAPAGAEADVLLVFFRGTWCPFCREQMRALSVYHATLDRAGVRVIGVVCQSADSVGRHVGANPLPFPLLADETRETARAYGVHYWVSRQGFNLATPSLFILDRARRITFRHVGRGMSDLPVTAVIERFASALAEQGRAGSAAAVS